MSTSPVEQNRRFSLDEATALLPWVRVIVRDIVELSELLALRHEVLERLGRPAVPADGDPYREELEASRAALAADAETVRGFVSELGKLGIVVVDLTTGSVDFPAVRGERQVWINWRHGEPELSSWRELHEDPKIRRPWTSESRSRFRELDSMAGGNG